MLLFELFEDTASDPAFYKVQANGSLNNLRVFNKNKAPLSHFIKNNLSLEDVDEMVEELKTNFPDIQEITKENVIPSHMGLDLVTDITQNSTEILAQYNSTGGDVDRTLAKLQSSNPSWRLIIQKHGREHAKKLILQHIKS